jgi:hypothetical protein
MFSRCLALVLAFAASAAGGDPLDQWESRTSAVSANLHSVGYGSGHFVAVGQFGTMLVSSNGINWNTISNATAALHGIAWGNDVFVAVGDAGTILCSSNAFNWTPQSSPITNHLKSIRYLNDRFIATGRGGAMLSSTNGESWTPLNSDSSMTLDGVAFGNELFCAVGGGNTHHASIAHSSDGLNWANQPVSFNYLHDMAFGNGVFVASGIRGQMWISSNTSNWIQKNSNSAFDYLFDITFAQGFFVAVGGPYSGGSQRIVTSTDGMNWLTRPVNAGLSPVLRGIAYGNGSFVAVGDQGIILQSGPVFHLKPNPGVGPLHWVLKGEAGRSYTFQCTENLVNWNSITNFVSAGETTLLIDSTATNSDLRFYRVVSP